MVQTEEQDKAADEAQGKKVMGRVVSTVAETGGFIISSDAALLGLGAGVLLAGVVEI